jgi:hypothetical protein
MSRVNGVDGETSLRRVRPEPTDLDRITNLRLLEAALPGADADCIRARYVREAEDQFERLAGPDRSPVDVVIARAIAANWLEVKLIRRRYSAELEHRGSISMLDHLQKTISRGERRMMAGLRTLEAIRKLNVGPAMLQLSVGKTLAGG